MSAEEREQVDRDNRKWKKCAANRKKIRNDVWAVVSDNVEKDKREQLKEDLDLSF